MTKEELEKYAHENRKRLDAQEVKIGDVIKVLRGQFAGETGVVVGIIACIGDYTAPYYEVNMDCEVPDKYKCRKNTLAQPNNVIGGLSAYEFEVIGNRAPMQSTEEIKVGDKVRVSKDAPKLLFTRSICNHPEYVFEVRAIEEELADIYYSAGKIPLAAFVIPTKYLIKVEDEEKNEPKFSIGDYVEDIAHPFPISDCIYQILDLFPTRAQIKSVNGDEPAKTVSLNRLKKIDESVFNPDGIKVGDKARLKSCGIIGNLVARIFICEIVTITAINGGMAAIRLDKDGQTYKMEDVPLRYLEIVEEGENALAEIKVGNMVQICDGSSPLSNGAIVKVVKIKGEYAEVEYKSRCRSTYKLEHLVPYASPSEPKKPSENEGERIRQAEEDLNEKAKEHLFRVLDNFSPQPMDDLILRNSWSVKPKLMFNSEYWLRYEADLAKEIAVKITNKKMDNDPKEAAEYAVSVAKAVVENLKKK